MGEEKPLPVGILDFVRRWAEETPDAPAVLDLLNGVTVTYRELWGRAGQLAVDLAGSGVVHGDLVAVDLERSAGLVVAFVGIARAGAAYLPLDEQAPAQRVATVLKDAAPRAVVARHVGGRTRQLGIPLIPVPDSPLADGPEVPAGGDDTLYVTYTSGSTGRPKGVVVPHRGVVRLVDQPDFCAIDQGDRVANTCNPAFDVTAAEIWGALTAGAAVVPFPSFVDAGLEDWLAMIRRACVTTMFLTTSIFHTVAWDKPDSFAALNDLVVAGEQMDLLATRRVLAAGPPKRLVNAYGPTEGTVFATYFACTDKSLADVERIPIGHPLEATDVYVIDDDLTDVVPGTAGELCLGGPGVAKGYLNRPDITRQRFVTHPASRALVYRTGDMVRELPDGELELLGRLDRQVKVRGFRVELDEIERVAAGEPMVDAVFVEVSGQGPSAIIAGAVLPSRDAVPSRAGEPVFDPAALNARLAEKLPAYMVPGRWVVLSEVPLGPTGKADRKAISRLLDQGPADERATRTGVSAMRMVVGTVAELLGQTAVLPTDNFVELGGNSLLAVRTAHRINAHLGTTLDAADVLNAESIGQLAARLGGA